MKKRVLNAREIQRERYNKSKYNYNSEVKGKDINKFFSLSLEGKNLIDIYYEKCNLTMRGYDKIIKVARTIADLDLSEKIYEYHIFEALGYRKNMNGEII
jgi:magnesium chelatase family protein